MTAAVSSGAPPERRCNLRRKSGAWPKDGSAPGHDGSATVAISPKRNQGAAPPLSWRPAAVLSLLAWAVSSSTMILGHKVAMVDKKFHFPLALTAAEQVIAALAGIVLSRAGVLKLGPPPAPWVFIKSVLPCALSFAGTLWLGNWSYLRLSMTFIQMLKAMVPAVTLSMLLIGRLERFSMPVLLAIVAITLGTGLTAVMEVGTATFDLMGFLAFTASAVLEALRCVLVQVLMGDLRYNAAEVLLFVGLPTGLLLAVAAVPSEGPGLVRYGWAIAWENPGLLALLAVSSAAVNVTSFLAIRFTSSLMFKVTGCMKNVAVVWLGVLMGDKVSKTQFLGYAVAMAGFVHYSLSCFDTLRKPRKQKLGKS